MSQVKLREKGQITIPVEILQEWHKKNHVNINDIVDAQLANGVVLLIPKQRHVSKRDIMSFAGIGKGLWGDTPEEIEKSIREVRHSWER